jgi:hypothetical protein
MTAQRYVDQVSLLVRAIPEIARDDIFALKGGTAINLFVRELPRLSINIDLVYLTLADRDRSLQAVAVLSKHDEIEVVGKDGANAFDVQSTDRERVDHYLSAQG